MMHEENGGGGGGGDGGSELDQSFYLLYVQTPLHMNTE